MQRHAAAVGMLLAALLGCDSGTTFAPGAPVAGLTATFEGAPWTAATYSATYSGGYLTVTGTAHDTSTLTFNLIANAPGSYPVGATTAVTARFVHHSASWAGGGSIGSGLVRIDAVDLAGASGTFIFTLPPTAGTAGRGTRSITAGSFAVRF